MKSKSISFKVDDDTLVLIEDVMSTYNLNQTEAIIHLMNNKGCYNISKDNKTIASYKEKLEKYKYLYIELAMDLRNALNRFEENGDKQAVLDVLEGFKCRI